MTGPYNCNGCKGFCLVCAEPVVNDSGAVVLFTVSEKQSIDDVIKDMGSANGMGWLFSIVQYTPEMYKETIGEDNSGMSFFARDDNNYYCYFTASDVRLYRAGGVLTAEALTEWQMLKDMSTVVRTGFIAKNGLTLYNG